jgi:glutamyl-Q tRNA(Asp) synthetase
MRLLFLPQKSYSNFAKATLFTGGLTSRGQMTVFIALPKDVAKDVAKDANDIAAIGSGQMVVTRFAPSPNGNLHVGHALSVICAHDFARLHGGRFLLRIEDIDGIRSRAEHNLSIIADLKWLGLSWDDDIIYQSQRVHQYQAALERLREMGLIYRCCCSRRDIDAAIRAQPVRHGPDGPVYPGTCKGQKMLDNARSCWRLDMQKALAHVGTQLGWTDLAAGYQIADPGIFGDVVLWRKDVPASYHLAATLDDDTDGITHVVRGQDLFAYTAVHILLQKLLGLLQPIYWHHPLMVDESGAKLAKSRSSPALRERRARGEDGRALAESIRRGQLPLGISQTNI